MTHGTRLRVVSRRCVAGRPTQKRTCASPVTFRAMPENEIPPAMRVDIYYAFERESTAYSNKLCFLVCYDSGGVCGSVGGVTGGSVGVTSAGGSVATGSVTTGSVGVSGAFVGSPIGACVAFVCAVEGCVVVAAVPLHCVQVPGILQER